MKKNCLQCGLEFEAERASAKFCSPSCRVAYNRNHTDEESLPAIENEEVAVEAEAKEEVKSGVSKRTGLSYDMDEKPQWGDFKKKKCGYCKEPTWSSPCNACAEEMRDPDRQAQMKHDAKWGDVCTVEEWKRYPSFCENKAQATALYQLYDNFTSEELAKQGIRPPKWKKFHKTHAEAVEAYKTMMSDMKLDLNTQGFWITPDKNIVEGKIDYKTWK